MRESEQRSTGPVDTGPIRKETSGLSMPTHHSEEQDIASSNARERDIKLKDKEYSTCPNVSLTSRELEELNNDFHRACRDGDLETVREFIRQGAGLNSKATADFLNWNDYTPLMRASDSGRSEVVKTLINEGADIEAKDRQGYTALLLATRCSKMKTVAVLVNAGAKLEETVHSYVFVSEEATAYMLAKFKGNTKVVNILLSAGAIVRNCELKEQPKLLETKAEPEKTELPWETKCKGGVDDTESTMRLQIKLISTWTSPTSRIFNYGAADPLEPDMPPQDYHHFHLTHQPRGDDVPTRTQLLQLNNNALKCPFPLTPLVHQPHRDDVPTRTQLLHNVFKRHFHLPHRDDVPTRTQLLQLRQLQLNALIRNIHLTQHQPHGDDVPTDTQLNSNANWLKETWKIQNFVDRYHLNSITQENHLSKIDERNDERNVWVHMSTRGLSLSCFSLQESVGMHRGAAPPLDFVTRILSSKYWMLEADKWADLLIICRWANPTTYTIDTNDVLCSICEKVWIQPVTTSCCGHTFCAHCVLEKFEDGCRNCPECEPMLRPTKAADKLLELYYKERRVPEEKLFIICKRKREDNDVPDAIKKKRVDQAPVSAAQETLARSSVLSPQTSEVKATANTAQLSQECSDETLLQLSTEIAGYDSYKHRLGLSDAEIENIDKNPQLFSSVPDKFYATLKKWKSKNIDFDDPFQSRATYSQLIQIAKRIGDGEAIRSIYKACVKHSSSAYASGVKQDEPMELLAQQ